MIVPLPLVSTTNEAPDTSTALDTAAVLGVNAIWSEIVTVPVSVGDALLTFELKVDQSLADKYPLTLLVALVIETVGVVVPLETLIHPEPETVVTVPLPRDCKKV